jgi:hypothetical protein
LPQLAPGQGQDAAGTGDGHAGEVLADLFERIDHPGIGQQPPHDRLVLPRRMDAFEEALSARRRGRAGGRRGRRTTGPRGDDDHAVPRLVEHPLGLVQSGGQGRAEERAERRGDRQLVARSGADGVGERRAAAGRVPGPVQEGVQRRQLRPQLGRGGARALDLPLRLPPPGAGLVGGLLGRS